ncbi:MAG TPA: four helix bundle protein [Pyrinomonadaceae bacterium]|jgi:four helix bundle protein|nr:four helix bundle protein [Pyrinomonadaceae bacterium]
MKYKRFEDLPVWNTAIDLAVAIYALTAKPECVPHPAVKDQIERAAVSVSNNIAEGFERGTNNELLTFLYISRGSAGEVRSMLTLLERLPWAKSLVEETKPARLKSESCSRQLKAWIQSLQDSDLKGERYVNEKTRRATEMAHQRDEFLAELDAIKNTRASNN